jgi:hypothetical protein
VYCFSHDAGLKLTVKSDYFSLGCVIAQLSLNEPVLCDVVDSTWYIRDKYLSMERGIRPFTPAFLSALDGVDIEGLFDVWSIVLTDDQVDDDVESFIRERSPIEVGASFTAATSSHTPGTGEDIGPRPLAGRRGADTVFASPSSRLFDTQAAVQLLPV